jgi:aminoglycoside phosphotransferase (APT) family kinase protein
MTRPAPAEAGATVPAAPDVAPVRAGEEMDWDRLAACLTALVPELEGPMRVGQFPRGSANLTYLVAFGDRELVVRRPPLGSRAPGSHDMGREYRVLAGLHPVYPRAPRPYGYVEDAAVIGDVFLVCERRRGVVVWDHVPAALSTEAGASVRVGLATVDALADLHAVDVEAAGLAGLGRPEGYLDRQLAGWSRRWAAVEEQSALPDHDATRRMMREVEQRLLQAVPRSQRPGLVHNDFKIDNCQFTEGDPDRVTSVFDWDMATYGDPLCDLGTLLNYWPDRTIDPSSSEAFVCVSATRDLELPSRHDVVERYAAGSELDLADIGWYEAFGCWKTCVILQQLHARAVRGESKDPRMLQRGEMVAPLARRALARLGHQV